MKKKLYFTDSCIYQKSTNSPCRFSNSTCLFCPWSRNYRIAWSVRDNMAFSVDRFVNGSLHYHSVVY